MKTSDSIYSGGRRLRSRPLNPPSHIARSAGTPQHVLCTRSIRRRLVGLALLACSLSPFNLPAAGEETHAITSAADFWGLSSSAGDRVYPLQGQIVVLYYDSDWNVLWADWDGVGCYLPGGTKPLPLKPGQRVELDGFAQPGRQNILWERTSIRVVDENVALEPVPLPVPLVHPMDLNLRIVTVEGLVCEQSEVDGTHTRLIVVSPDWKLTAQVYLLPDIPIPQFRGAFVKMRGVFSVKEDVTHLTSDLEMWVSDIRHIEVTSWLTNDARFDLPDTPMEKLYEAPRDRLARVEGIVHAVEPGTSLMLRDATGEVRVMTRQPEAAAPGDVVEAIGYPVLDGVESRLLRSYVRAARTSDSPAEQAGSVAEPRLKLRLTEQVRSLDPADAGRGNPVDIHGVVSWSDPAADSFFIMDSSGGVEAALPDDGSITAPGFGEDVIVQGETQAGSFVPIVRATMLTPTKIRTLPAPKPVTFEQVITGAEYGEWCEIRGYVHSVASDPGGIARIDLTTPGGELILRVRGLDPDNSLLGALIRAWGVCDAIVNSRRQLTGVQFLVSSPDLIRVEQPAPADMFAAPQLSIGGLLQFGASRSLNHRVQVSGVVTLHRPGALLYLEDGDDRLLVLSRQADALRPGDRVDVVGIPGNEAGRLVMRDAVYRLVRTGPAPSPKTVEDPELSKIEWDGMTMRLRGRLLYQSNSGDGTRLRLQHGNTIFEARGPKVSEGTLAVGSLLEVRGVYRVEFDEYRQPRGFALDLRSPGDVRVVNRPPWWTSTHMLWAGGALLLVVIITAGWGLSLAHKNSLLRKADSELNKANTALEARVAERTRDLRLEITQRQSSEEALAGERRLLRTLIDNLPVHLYVKNTERSFVIGNLPHAGLLGATPGAEVIGKTDYDLHPRELAQRYELDDLRVLGTGEPLLQHEEPSHIDGQPGWFSTTKVPLRDREGRIVGLIGISQDITARKEAEQKLKEAHEQLVKASRQAGMAEVATGVLHNVGNVLNSVNVSATLVRETLRNSEVATLGRVAELIKEHNGDLAAYLTGDPKGRLVPDIVIQLADHLAREHATLRTEHEHLAKNVEHIKGIVAMQQNYATVSGVLEKVRIADLLGDALQMHAVSFVRDGIEIVRDYADIPLAVVDKHRVMQILVNLVTNARHALNESKRTDGRITVRIAMHGRDRVRVSISDNGVGIPADNLMRIFSHGFTTRANGHGFGLHSGAIAAREMGGFLKVESAGAGLGATFILELPISPNGRSMNDDPPVEGPAPTA